MIKGKILIYTYQNPTSDGYPVKIRISDGKLGKKKYINTGHYSHKEYWGESEPLPKHPQYNQLMVDILDWRKKLFEIIPKANRENWNIEKVVQQFKNSRYFDIWEFVNELKNISDKTKELYGSALRSFEKFAGHFNIESIDSRDVERYIEHQLQHQNNNGLNVYLRQLKAIVNKAIKLGYYDGKNPFTRKLLPSIKTKNPILTDEDIIRIRDADFKEGSTAWHYRNYFMLLFYIGGIYPIDLVNLRYDKNLVNDRIEFSRGKGGTNEFISNKMLPEIERILSMYDCKSYFVPIYKLKYESFQNNFTKRFPLYCKELELSQRPIARSARYTFINRAKELLIDERITMELVGHARKGTHSIYQNDFPYHIRDEAHAKIITL